MMKLACVSGMGLPRLPWPCGRSVFGPRVCAGPEHLLASDGGL